MISSNEHQVGLLDWLMLALAVVSIALLSWETWGEVDDVTRTLILRIDLAICALFALEFAWRVRRTQDRRRFILRNWYEVLGMIPVAHPAIRGFRLIRVLRILILLGRFGAAADRAMGEHFTHRLLTRLGRRIVAPLSAIITVAVLDEVANVLSHGDYTRNIVAALDENEAELRTMLSEKLRDDPELRRFALLPFYGLVLDAAIAASLRVTRATLVDPRTEELIADALRENLQQLRAAVETQARSGGLTST